MAPAYKLSIGVNIDPAGAKSGGAATQAAVAAIGTEAETTATKLQRLINTSVGLASGPANQNIREWNGALAAQGKTIDDLRAKYNPLFAVIREYKSSLTEIRTLTAQGILTTDEMTAAITRQRQATLASIDAIKGRNSAISQGGQRFATTNVMIGYGGGSNSIIARRQTSVNNYIGLSASPGAINAYGQLTQVAMWRTADEFGLRLKTVDGQNGQTAAAGAKDTADFSTAVGAFGVPKGFWTTAGLTADELDAVKFRLHRGFVENLARSGRDPVDVLDADWARQINRAVFN